VPWSATSSDLAVRSIVNRAACPRKLNFNLLHC